VDPVGIVTGGSRGAGRMIVHELARRGYAVVVIFLRDRQAAENAGAALTIRADVTDALDVERIFDETLAVYGAVDVVVHAAPCSAPVLELEAARRGLSVEYWRPGPRPGTPRARSIPPDREGRSHPQSNGGDMTVSAAETTTSTAANRIVDMKLEVVVLPVADVDRAKQFYLALGWREDADLATSEDFRVVQLTPPGSTASIIFGTGVTDAEPGSVDSLILVVEDIEAARADLASRGVDTSEVFHDEGGIFHHAGTNARVAGPDPERRSYGSWVSFSDPDGNGWLLQEITTRLPGR
jgi:catechol 2,3-dioxygenase-like lactoylglutathione lyase family enzyme